MTIKPLLLVVAALGVSSVLAAEKPDPRRELGSPELTRYFERQVAALEHPMAKIQSAEDWKAQEPELRRQWEEMLGLDPMPEKTDLKPVITGTIEKEDFVVEKIHFQSRPGLYVTANFYIPKSAKQAPVPTILYVCGHGRVKIDNVSYGNKVSYHHHGVWYARNGYACLIIDTLQMGEIEGIHHGTHNQERWWWPARGYSSAAVEAWNGIRAIDYLETRPEVDKTKFGVTGRSGGGAYSWWAVTLDPRIKVAVPVAGITSLRDHIVHGCIEGHCDCMFQLNTYRWDFGRVAALAAPKPLLISNTDKDGIFPLEGVVDVHAEARRLYRLMGEGAKIGLNIEEGPHMDVQPLQTASFHWFNRHLKGGDLMAKIDVVANKIFEPKDLKVFAELPADEINTKIDETFVPLAQTPAPPADAAAWSSQRESWMKALREKSFRGWPEASTPANLKLTWEGAAEGVRLQAYTLTTEPEVTCSLYVIRRDGLTLADLDLQVLNVLDETDWQDFLSHIPTLFPQAFPGVTLPAKNEEQLKAELGMYQAQKWGMAYLCPRGIGPANWPKEAKKLTQIKRRYNLIGQTLDGMRVWDIKQAAEALRANGLGERPLWMQAQGVMAGNTLYASLFTAKPVSRLDLHQPAKSHHTGASYLNVLRYLDMPQAVAMAAVNTRLAMYGVEEADWAYPLAVAKNLGWKEKQIQLRGAVPTDAKPAEGHAPAPPVKPQP